MEARKTISKREIEEMDLSKLAEGAQELELKAGITIDLNEKRKELLAAFDEKTRMNESIHTNISSLDKALDRLKGLTSMLNDNSITQSEILQ